MHRLVRIIALFLVSTIFVVNAMEEHGRFGKYVVCKEKKHNKKRKKKKHRKKRSKKRNAPQENSLLSQLPAEVVENIVKYTLDDLSINTFDKRLYSLQGLPRVVYFEIARPTYFKVLRAISSIFFTKNFEHIFETNLEHKVYFVNDVHLDFVSNKNFRIAVMAWQFYDKRRFKSKKWNMRDYVLEYQKDKGGVTLLQKKYENESKCSDISGSGFPDSKRDEQYEWYNLEDPVSKKWMKHADLDDLKFVSSYQGYYGKKKELVSFVPFSELAAYVSYQRIKMGLFCSRRRELCNIFFEKGPTVFPMSPYIVPFPVPNIPSMKKDYTNLYWPLFSELMLVYDNKKSKQLYYSYTEDAGNMQLLFKNAVCKAFLNNNNRLLLLLRNKSHDYFKGIQELVMCNWCHQLAAQLIAKKILMSCDNRLIKEFKNTKKLYPKDHIMQAVSGFLCNMLWKFEKNCKSKKIVQINSKKLLGETWDFVEKFNYRSEITPYSRSIKKEFDRNNPCYIAYFKSNARKLYKQLAKQDREIATFKELKTYLKKHGRESIIPS